MPRTDCRLVYQYDELPTDRAKQAARDWLRRANEGDNFFAEYVIEDATTIARLLGLVLDKQGIAWSGFSSQGDGASLTGSWDYLPGREAAIREYAPQDAGLIAIAADLDESGAAVGALTVGATLHRISSHYCHEHTVSIEVEATDAEGHDVPVSKAHADAIGAALHNFMRWIYRALETSYDDANSDETIAENIRANEYEFTDTGKRI